MRRALTDTFARLMAQKLTEQLGKQVYVENKSGADGNIGMEQAAKSAPDGYTVLVVPDQAASAAHVFRLNFDPAKGGYSPAAWPEELKQLRTQLALPFQDY